MKKKNDSVLFGLDNVESFHLNESEIILPPSDKTFKFLIYPNTKFYQVWNWLILALLLYTAILVPVQICFPSDFSINWIFFDTAIDFIFFLDIFINFNKAFYDKYSRLITSKKQIAKQYLKTWFLIDMLSCLPIQITQNSAIFDSNSYLRILRFNRAYRIFGLLKFLRLLRTSHYAKKLYSIIKFNSMPLKICMLLLVTWLFVHALGCIWILISEAENLTHQNWYVRMKMGNYSSIDVYLCAVYYVFTTITTLGYGDIVAVTNPEKIFTILIMGLGIGLYSIIISNMNAALTNIDGMNMLLQSKISFLRDFSAAVNLPDETRNKIKEYIHLNADKHLYSFNDLDFLRDIPFALREKLGKHLHKTLVDKIYFFQDKSSEFLGAIVPRLRKFVYSAGDIIYSKGDEADEIFFINKGRVLFQTKNEITFRSYSQGSYFGEVEVLEGIPRIDTVLVASLELEAFGLLKNDFLEVTSSFSEIFAEVRACSLVRKIKHQECAKRVISVKHDDERPDHTFSSSEISDFSELSAEEPTYILRTDTNILISLQSDNDVKKRNRAIWSDAIDGNPKGRLYKRAKTMKAIIEFDKKQALELNNTFSNQEELASKSVVHECKIEETKIITSSKPKITNKAASKNAIYKKRDKPINREKKCDTKWIYNNRYHERILHENYMESDSLRKVQDRVEEQGARIEDAFSQLYRSSLELSIQQNNFKQQITALAAKYPLRNT